MIATIAMDTPPVIHSGSPLPTPRGSEHDLYGNRHADSRTNIFSDRGHSEDGGSAYHLSSPSFPPPRTTGHGYEYDDDGPPPPYSGGGRAPAYGAPRKVLAISKHATPIRYTFVEVEVGLRVASFGVCVAGLVIMSGAWEVWKPRGIVISAVSRIPSAVGSLGFAG